MMCNRKFAAILAIAVCVAVVSLAQKRSQAQVVVYSGYGAYYGSYGVYAPVYPAPIYAPVYAAPVYAAPAPVVYGAYYAPYPAVAPIGHGVIVPKNGLEVNYEFRNGLWYVDIDD